MRHFLNYLVSRNLMKMISSLNRHHYFLALCRLMSRVLLFLINEKFRNSNLLFSSNLNVDQMFGWKQLNLDELMLLPILTKQKVSSPIVSIFTKHCQKLAQLISQLLP